MGANIEFPEEFLVNYPGLKQLGLSLALPALAGIRDHSRLTAALLLHTELRQRWTHQP
jgi:hypothetical protein